MENKKTVLFVDDQEEILMLLERMLRKEDYNTVFINSGHEALEFLKKNDVNVIISDIAMPEMNGMDLLGKVKNLYPNIVRMVLSGHSNLPIVLNAINKGEIYRFIPKPWKLDEEARELIQNALKHSDELRMQNLYAGGSYLSIQKVFELLEKMNIHFEWYFRDNIIYSNVTQKEGVINSSSFIEIDNNNKVYFF